MLLGALIAVTAPLPAAAHPMGNFSINHYARIEARGDRIAIRFLLDMAEIPTVSERSAMDTDHNGQISDAERDAYLRAKALSLRDGLTLTINGKPTPLEVTPVSLVFRPGAGGLPIMLLTLDLTARLPDAHAGANYDITYQDTNFVERTGWKDILILTGPGAKVLKSSAPATDLSKGLTAYPTDPSIVPPQDMSAQFTMTVTQSGAYAGTIAMPAPGGNAPAASSTPQDAFTQSIARRQLTPGLILLSLGLAFVFGSFHALSPGHGKAMVAAYLVGARGTARHAAFLGAVVTITHTIGVFALGCIALVAAHYIVPERLYPILSALSGLAIVGIGISLLWQRIRALRSASAHVHSHDHTHPHTHDHDHSHEHSHEHDPVHDLSHSHDHVHPHAHDHVHEDAHDHSHSHDDAHPHTHDHVHTHDLAPNAQPPMPNALYYHDHGDGHYHSHHVPDDMPISLKTLLILGITGGALPCPSALVVMLSAIALHRVAFGLALITAFSLGLATVLTGIGMLVVYARGFLDRMPSQGRLLSRLPVLSAAIVTAIGLVLVIRAVGGAF
jgi:ABC-type nickel/cobalt efflux system permease component RcnA